MCRGERRSPHKRLSIKFTIYNNIATIEMKFKIITSHSNPFILKIVSLHTHKGREREGAFLAEGFSIVEDALSSACRVRTLIIRNDMLENKRTKFLLKKAEKKVIKTIVVSEKVFQKITTRETPQGIAAEIEEPILPPWEKALPHGLLLMVERLQDPRNAGLLLRTSLAAGVNAVFLTRDSVDPFHPISVQTSMGAVLHLPVYTKVDPIRLIDCVHASGGEAYAAMPGGTIDMRKWNPSASLQLLVFGNESRGVSDTVRETCNGTISIPIFGKVESLNIAVAAGILCYQFKTTKK